MTVYLCTSGTSAARNLQPGFDSKWIESHGGIDAAATQVLKTFRQYRMDDENALHKVLSAEIHSLARMPLETTDRVYLFSSETPDGQACAHAVALYLRERLPELTAKVEVVEGLQVNDETRFRTIGVVEYVKRILRLIEDYGPTQCVLNPTGGYKVLVPYTVLVGMIKQVRARYIFEHSSSLIELPPLPLEFSQCRIESIRGLLEKIERESAISKTEFENELTWEQRQDLKPLFEITANDVTLSAIGFLVFEELTKPAALTPFLSQQALTGFKTLRQRADCDPQRYLRKVSCDSKALQQDKHGNAGQGLTWLKPGNTTDRYLISEEGWKMLVWKIVAHDEYEKLSANPRLGSQVIAERVSKYAPFMRMEFTD